MHLMLVLLLDGIDSHVNVIYLFKATIKLNYVVSCLIVSLSSNLKAVIVCKSSTALIGPRICYSQH